MTRCMAITVRLVYTFDLHRRSGFIIILGFRTSRVLIPAKLQCYGEDRTPGYELGGSVVLGEESVPGTNS